MWVYGWSGNHTSYELLCEYHTTGTQHNKSMVP